MTGESAGNLFKRVQNYISGRLSEIDIETFEKSEQKIVKDMKRLTADCRLDIRDWEYADTRYEMEIHAKSAAERLAQLREKILAASEFGIFGAADVAQLSAQVDSVVGRVRR